MPQRRRSHRRPLITRRAKRLFVLACEGRNAEPRYFRRFSESDSAVSVKCLPVAGKSPERLLRKLRRNVDDNPLSPNDEAWMVVDRDQWSPSERDRLSSWIQSEQQYGLALSNPSFEYWLLLHFEDGYGINSARDCMHRLKRHIPHYDKSVDRMDCTQDQIRQAISRAKALDVHRAEDWPKKPGITTVYRLAEKLVADSTW